MSRSTCWAWAEMVGADLQEAVAAKLAVNEAREYQRLPNGVLGEGCVHGPAAVSVCVAVRLTPFPRWRRARLPAGRYAGRMPLAPAGGAWRAAGLR